MPIPPATNKEQKAIDDLIKQISAKGDVEIARIVNEWRKNIVLLVAESGKEMDALSVDVLKARLDRLARQFEMMLTKELTDNQRKQFIKGIQSVDRIIKSGGISHALPFLSERKLEALQNYSAAQVQGLVGNALRNVTSELDLAVLGQKFAVDVIDNIGRNLEDPSIFGTVAKRAQVIYQTEVKRIQNMTTHDRIIQMKQQVKDIGKRWIHSHIGIPRPGHLVLDGTVVAAEEQFELVGADGEIYYVDYPHDPSLPVGEVANCRCSITVVAMRFLDEGA
jgi:hypothetical protein